MHRKERFEKADANCLWNYRLSGHSYLILTFLAWAAKKKKRLMKMLFIIGWANVLPRLEGKN